MTNFGITFIVYGLEMNMVLCSGNLIFFSLLTLLYNVASIIKAQRSLFYDILWRSPNSEL